MATISPQRGYPLVALFVLVAVCAILAAMSAPVVGVVISGQVGVGTVLAVTAAAGLATSCVGVVVGLHHHRRLIGALVGAGAGLVVGLLIGPLLVVPPDGFFSLLFAALGGSVVLLLIGVITRWMSRR